MPLIKKGCESPLASLMASSLDLFVFKRLFQRQVYGYARPEHQRLDNQVIAQTHSVSIDEDCSF
jgi:hypothetical protein